MSSRSPFVRSHARIYDTIGTQYARHRVDLHAPSIDHIAHALGANRVEPVLVPFDCSDGFLAAYWRRPERYLEASVRACISGLSQLDPALVERGITKLRDDLASGRWHARHTDLLSADAMDWGYRLIVSEPTPT
jgi:hypothetical protein